MIVLSAIVAAAINARLDTAARRQLRAFVGMSAAVQGGGYQMCWRIHDGGIWRAASPLIESDVVVRLGANGEWQIGGNGALLRELGDLWLNYRPQLSVLSALPGGGCLAAAAAQINLNNIPLRCNIVASAAEVADFNQQAATFANKTAALRARLTKLENMRR